MFYIIPQMGYLSMDIGIMMEKLWDILVPEKHPTPMKKRSLQALMLKTLFVKPISRLLPTDNVMEVAYIGLKPSSFNTVM